MSRHCRPLVFQALKVEIHMLRSMKLQPCTSISLQPCNNSVAVEELNSVNIVRIVNDGPSILY